ncbi:Uncharacterised protein [Bordetella pertussis]|nr:Uncharacterised protein [Bordetella pertussis]CPH81289.1 Uncharacterised protein [Bordetella pertussis]CPI27581.1 Uncharacterised protein [Bordetella pertussis]CPN74721.1 Uncharacterised protein [Bordetella pertussis]CPO60533.1 Uncharacterised protein [Bordetella pertussis]
MRQAAVQPHHQAGAGQHLRHRRQIHARQHFHALHAGNQHAGALGLLLVAGQQAQGAAGILQPPEYGAPIVLGPQFVVAAGRRHDHRITPVGRQVQHAAARIGRRIVGLRGPAECLQSEIGRSRVVVAKGQRGQLALAYHGRLPELHPVPDVVKQRHQRLARGAPVQAVAHPAGLPHQPGRFQQPLHIQHDIVGHRAQALGQRAAFLAHRLGPPGLAPAPVCHLDHLIDRRMPFRDIGKSLFRNPVNLGIGNVSGDIGNSRQHMHQIAKRRGANDENTIWHQ